MSAWVDGRRCTMLEHRDRGLQYGDGVFETMRVRAGTVRLLDEHLGRLRFGCRRLGFDAPPAKVLRGELQHAARGLASGVLKLIVTRGVGERGYRPPLRARVTRILTAHPLPESVADTPVVVRMCRTPLSTNPALAGLKTLNRLDSVLARAEWRDPRIFEGLMRDAEGHIVCGTMSNLFLRRRTALLTPGLERCGVAGVMRGWVLERAAGLPLTVVQRPVQWADVEGAEEIFLTNAVVGIVSVGRVRDGQRSVVTHSRELAQQLRERLARE